MVYQEHPDIGTPERDLLLWRYMDLPRLVSLLDRQALWFARADLLGDPFEGSVTEGTLRAVREVHSTIPNGSFETWSNFRCEFRKRVYASCWHRSEYESAGLWSIYAGRLGVVVRSSVGRLMDAITDSADVYIGAITYADYSIEVIPYDNAMQAFFCKRASFQHEQEVRALHVEWNALFPDSVPALPGRYVEVDIKQLVECIYVQPEADSWYVDAVEAVVSRFSLSVPVRQSNLSGDPVW